MYHTAHSSQVKWITFLNMKARPRKYPVSAQIREECGAQLEAIVEHAKKADSRASKTTVIEQMIAEKHKRLKL